jgi:hypothetical protein
MQARHLEDDAAEGRICRWHAAGDGLELLDRIPFDLDRDPLLGTVLGDVSSTRLRIAASVLGLRKSLKTICRLRRISSQRTPPASMASVNVATSDVRKFFSVHSLRSADSWSGFSLVRLKALSRGSHHLSRSRESDCPMDANRARFYPNVRPAPAYLRGETRHFLYRPRPTSVRDDCIEIEFENKPSRRNSASVLRWAT